MTSDDRLISEQFPRSSKYHPEWVLANASGGANSLWLTEWLTSGLDLRPGMRVLDLGCGRASSSIFLHREFGIEVWATDLWFSAAENIQRIRDAGAQDGVFPLHADARSLPFAPEFFDAIVCIDSYPYFGTDDLYLNYLAQFVKPGGPIGMAGAGLIEEIEGDVPEHLRAWWTQDFWAFHSASWCDGIGSEPASWRWPWPIRCRTVGSSGSIGIMPLPPTTPRSSKPSKPTQVDLSGTSAWWGIAGARRSWKTTAGPIHFEPSCPSSTPRSPCSETKKHECRSAHALVLPRTVQ